MTAQEHALPPTPSARVLGALARSPGAVAGVALAALAAFGLPRVLAEHDLGAAAAHLGAVTPARLGLALLLTALSFLALAGYDLSALRYASVRLPLRTVAFGAFAGYAVGNALGLSMLSGGSVRFRIYSAAGVRPADIAKAVMFSGVTFSCGLTLMGAAGLLAAPAPVAALSGMPEGWVRAIGLGALAAAGGLALLAALRREPLVVAGRRIALPSPGLMAVQALISSADIALTAGVLHALLPPGSGVGFAELLGLFGAGVALGQLTHLPGGIGVFDATIMAGLSGRVPPDALLGALVGYRAIYYLLPLALAAAALALREARAQRARMRTAFRAAIRLARRRLPRLVPALSACLILACGAAMLASGATPSIRSRMHVVSAVLPLPILELSHLLASLVGVFLLLLARGVHRRLDAAWALAVAALGAGIVLSLAKGLDYEEAGLLAVALAILVACRRQFHRRAALVDLRPSPGQLLAMAGVVAGVAWLVFFSFSHVEYRNELWWRFALSADAPRSLRGALVAALAVLSLGLLRLLRPAAARPAAPDAAAIERAKAILARCPRPDGQIALLGDKSLLFDETGTAFLMYGVHGQSWVVLGDPVGPPERHAELVWRFRELCHHHGGVPAFYQISPAAMPLCLDAGMSLLKLGETARVDLGRFGLDGPAMRDMRYAHRKGTREGLSFEVVPAAEVGGILDEVERVSAAWLAAKGGREKGFSLGNFDRAYIRHFDCAVVRREGRVVAFANLWLPAPGGDASLDLMRHLPDAPAATMDFLFLSLMLWAKERGYGGFDLGMAPLSGLAARSLAPFWHRVGALVFERGTSFYNFRGLRRYKEKFLPEWQPRYLACPGGLAPAWVLSDVTALVSGGSVPGGLLAVALAKALPR
jgi:phosphatidylglycerol lysyltransferase